MLFDSTMSTNQANTASSTSSTGVDINSIIGKSVGTTNDETTFNPEELGEHRIVRPGEMSTSEYKDTRTTITVNDEDIAVQVKKG